MKLDKFVYLDSYATVPCSLENVAFTSKYIRSLNPSAPYSVNNKVKGYLVENNLKDKLSKLLGVNKNHIIINSGGSEGNSNIIFSRGVFGKGEIVCSSLDHPSILNGVYELWTRGIPVRMVKVKNGCLTPEDVLRKISYQTNLVLLTHVFSEVGMINNVEKIAEVVKKKCPNCHVHVDAVQSFMKIKNNIPNLKNIDSLAASFHKIGGDKGCGFLWVRNMNNLMPLVFGNHNNKKRGGTSNVSGYASAVYAIQETERLNNKQSDWRDLLLYLISKLREVFSNDFIKVYTDPKKALGNCLVIAFKNIDNRVIQRHLYNKNIIVGTGSACNSECVYKKGKVSPIIDSFKASNQFIKPIRISWNKRSSKICIDKLLNELVPFLYKFSKNPNVKR